GDQVPEIGQIAGPTEVVFTMKPGDISGPIPAGNNGVVIALTDRKEPAPAEFEQQKDQIRQSVLQRKRSEAIQIYVTNLRDKMQKDGKIRINDRTPTSFCGNCRKLAKRFGHLTGSGK